MPSGESPDPSVRVVVLAVALLLLVELAARLVDARAAEALVAPERHVEVREELVHAAAHRLRRRRVAVGGGLVVVRRGD